MLSQTETLLDTPNEQNEYTVATLSHLDNLTADVQLHKFCQINFNMLKFGNQSYVYLHRPTCKCKVYLKTYLKIESVVNCHRLLFDE